MLPYNSFLPFSSSFVLPPTYKLFKAMLSTVLPFEPTLSNSISNPFSFHGGFTSWENLEPFFTPTLHKPNDPSIKPMSSNKSDNLSCYHAGFGLGKERSNLSGSDLGSEQPNLSCYHAGSDLGSDIPSKVSPKANLGSYHAGSDLLGSQSQSTNTDCFDEINLSPNHADFESPTQQSPYIDLIPYHVGTDLGSKRPNQRSSPSCEELSPESNQNSNPTNSGSSSGSDDPDQNPPRSNPRTCADGPVKAASTTENERKRKRMISNRESAKRSRMRKQKHLENLRNNANELKIQTRERSNTLRLMTHHIQHVRRENEQLKAESIILQRKLMHLSHFWKLQQLQQQQQSSFSTTSNLMHAHAN